MPHQLSVKIYLGDELQGEQDITVDVIKIGRLRSSTIVLEGEGVARMHAAIDKTGGKYHLIDLGSSQGCTFNGKKVDKHVELGKEGTLGIGPFNLVYEVQEVANLGEDSQQEAPRYIGPSEKKRDSRLGSGALLGDLVNALKESLGPMGEAFAENLGKEQQAAEDDKGHHHALMASLVEELNKRDSSSAPRAEKVLAMWFMLSSERQRDSIRLAVKDIRECRRRDKITEHKRIATMLNIGIEGMEAIYALTQGQALEKAHETLMGLVATKGAIAMLHGFGFDTAMKNAVESLPADQQARELASVEGFMGAHDKLIDRLQNEFVGGSSLLPLYLSRAGGHEVTEEERAQWKKMFSTVKLLHPESANEAPPPEVS